MSLKLSVPATAFFSVIVLIVLLLMGDVSPVFGQSLNSVPYENVPGVDPQLTSLDVYSAGTFTHAPVVILVHGGGWTTGDKSHFAKATNLQDFFKRNGILTVAINLRLVQDQRTPNTTYREQATDVAKAIRWVYDNIAKYGGDPNNISLLGFSSGSHLVALVGTDDRYLKQQGLSLSSIKGIMSFDVDAYDIPLAIKEASAYGWPPAAKNLPNIFSNDVNVQKDASPVNFISSAKHHPPFLVVYSGQLEGSSTQTLSRRQSAIFVQALTSQGVPASITGHIAVRHVDLILRLGTSDFVLTSIVQSFIDTYIKQTSRDVYRSSQVPQPADLERSY